MQESKTKQKNQTTSKKKQSLETDLQMTVIGIGRQGLSNKYTKYTKSLT